MMSVSVRCTVEMYSRSLADLSTSVILENACWLEHFDADYRQGLYDVHY